MIVRSQSVLVRQTEHAALSAAFARAWPSEFPHRDSVLVATHRHDDGWAEWELSPRLLNGRPMDFTNTPVEDHVALYKRGIDLVEVEDPLAGLIASMHGERLYTQKRSGSSLVDRLGGRDQELAQEFIGYERQRQAVLSETAMEWLGGPLVVGDLAADAESAWSLLQVWDVLSLYVCMGQADFDLPGGTKATLSDGALKLSDDLLSAGSDFQFETLELSNWDDEPSFRAAYRNATRKMVSIATG